MQVRVTPISEILNRLLFENKIRATELARQIDIPQPTIHRISTGKSLKPGRAVLEPIARFFSISVEQLCGEEPLPSGALKTTFPVSSQKATEVKKISWSGMNDLSSSIMQSNETVLASPQLGEHCFAVTMNDCSMEPLFARGCTLVINTDKEPYDRSYVMVKLAKNDQVVFRQILIDIDDQFLKPINPELGGTHMRALEGDDEVLGVLVETRQVFGEI